MAVSKPVRRRAALAAATTIVLSLAPAGSAVSAAAKRAGVSSEFVYGIVNGLNTFTVKAVDRTGNTSVASNAVSTQLWLC